MSNFNRESDFGWANDFDGDSDFGWANDFDGDSDFIWDSDFGWANNFDKDGDFTYYAILLGLVILIRWEKWLSWQNNYSSNTISAGKLKNPENNRDPI